jgi:hypothetical protein
MKTAGCVLSSFLLFCMACKEQPQSYTISLHLRLVHGKQDSV